jgi:hypothetical protein
LPPFFILKIMTLYDYIAVKAPNDAFAVLRNKQLINRRPTSPEELSHHLKGYVRMYGKEALQDLANIHPDKELILSMDRPVRNSDFHNACGCGLSCDGNNKCSSCRSKEKNESPLNFLNFTPQPTPQIDASKTHEILIAVALLIGSAALLVKYSK